MNILQFFKRGSGIHIKKENRGKFTDYCGGKVTSECIAKGKRSSNPAIRKRATFAANARKWKHEDGGKVHQAFVNGVSILDSNPDAYKFVKRKLHKAAKGDKTGNWFQRNSELLNTLGGSLTEGISSITDSIQAQKKAKQQIQANEISDNVTEQELINQYYQEELNNIQENPSEDIHNSPIVAQNTAYQRAWNKANSEMQSKRYKTKLNNLQLQQEGTSGITNAITGMAGDFVKTGLGLLAQSKINNISTFSKQSTIPAWMQPYLKYNDN